MTREEAILCLKGMKNYARDTFTEQTDWQTSLDIAIKALEQESVLDKIRAEIEALNPVDYVSMSSYEGHKGARDMKADILQIIDKCKEESERKI